VSALSAPITSSRPAFHRVVFSILSQRLQLQHWSFHAESHLPFQLIELWDICKYLYPRCISLSQHSLMCAPVHLNKYALYKELGLTVTRHGVWGCAGEGGVRNLQSPPLGSSSLVPPRIHWHFFCGNYFLIYVSNTRYKTKHAWVNITHTLTHTDTHWLHRVRHSVPPL